MKVNFRTGMKLELKYIYFAALLASALFINEYLVLWVIAVRVGGHGVASGFNDAFEDFSLFGYLFLTAFRIVPYAGLWIVLSRLSKTEFKDYVHPVFVGGFFGIIAMIAWGSWTALEPVYTDEYASSTTAIAFLFIPIFAVLTGAVGAIAMCILYAPIRILFKHSGNQ